MLTKLAGGRIIDPLNHLNGEVRDIWVAGGRIVAAPVGGRDADEVVDLAGRVVMAGGIDMHSHIGGGKVNIARMLLPEEHREHLHPATAEGCRCGSGLASPSTVQHRLRLRGHGLHDGLRAGDAGGQRAAGPPGDGGHAAAR
jgi:formylmethanofuran dehydrogenase subunit A